MMQLLLLRLQRFPVGISQAVEEVELARALEPFAAIDGDDLAIDVAGEIAEQEGGEIGEFDMVRDALWGVLAKEDLRQLGGWHEVLPCAGRQEGAWRDRI